MKRPAIDRFEAQYIPEPMSGCWIWTGAAGRTRLEYGSFWMDGRNMPAHRFSYTVHRGPIPPNMVVMHKCDNPSCVNPDHLSVGTLADNSRDMVRKGRQARGINHGRNKLHPDDVKLIRVSQAPTIQLARRYGVSPRAIYGIRKGEKWREQ